MFSWNSHFFYDPVDVGNWISASSSFSKPNLYVWKFLDHTLLKPSLKDFEHDLASMWNEGNCAVVWTFFGIAFLWDWNENWPFPATAELSKFAGILRRSLNRVWLFATPWTITVDVILQARILKWVAVPFSRGSSQLRDQTEVSHIASRFFTSWDTREAQVYWSG